MKKPSKKHSKIKLKKIIQLGMLGGLAAVAGGALVGCGDGADRSGLDGGGGGQAQPQGAFVIIEESAPGQYKIKDQFPSDETRVVLKQLDGTERVLSKEEMDALIKQESAKIDNGSSNLTQQSGGEGGSGAIHSGGFSLGEAILASAAGAIIGSWIGSKLFNNPNFANQQRNAFSNQSAYQRSANSFNKASTARSGTAGRSGFFGGNSGGSNSAGKTTSSFGS